MLSVENPPPDPPCARKFPQLNSNGSDEIEIEKPSSPSPQLPLPQPQPQPQPEVAIDLSNPLHRQPQFGHHTNFSIRDYVLSARDKDIRQNWPFSPKNLQLCFKYGVKDVLPPFQPLDSLRNNQALRPCAVETSSLENQQKCSFNKEPPRQDGCVVLGSSEDVHLNQKLAEPCIDSTSCRSADEKDFPSTVTTVSQSEIESVRDTDNRQSISPLETENLLKAEAGGPPVTCKTESNSRPSGKKCRLIVKFGGNCDRASTEDIASYCTTASETMASQVCPVCETFSSPSNTTLNAHIDQCLSVESPPKWTANSKLTRHRIKPKKTRLMVDIYATAQPCTLEELDRRNGTSWATVSTLPILGIQTPGTSSEGKKHSVSPVHPENVGDVGPVYIDADGTKVRILSKSSDPAPGTKGGMDLGVRKSFKGGKVSQHLLKKKKKHLTQKHRKYLKLACQSRKIFSHNHMKAHRSQISRNEEGDNGEGKRSKKEHILKQKKPSDSGTLRPWVRSKRRAFTKKFVSNEGHQTMRCKWHSPQDLLVENDQCYLGDSRAEENRVQKYTKLPSSGNNERMEKPFHKALASDKRDKPPGRKGVGNLLLGAKLTDNVVLPCPPTKWGADQLGKDMMSIDDRCLQNQKTVIEEDAANNSNISPTTCSKSSWNSHAILTKSVRLSSGKNSISASRQSTVARNRLSKIKKQLDLKNSIMHSIMERDEEELPWDSEGDQQYTLIHSNTDNQISREEMTDNVCVGRSTFPETKQERGLFSVSHSMEALALKSSKYTPRYGHDEGLNLYSLVRAGDDFQPKADCLEPCGKGVGVRVEGIVIDPSSKSFDRRRTTSLNASVNNKFYKLNDSSKAQDNPLQSIEEYRQLLCGVEAPSDPIEPDFVHEQMSSADEVHNRMMEQNADMGLELGAEVRRANPFPEVDPIPIPGPPGSFLPSPRDMRSEDFQGNSSLTTSRVQSSPDQHDMIDGDSSDSPISPASTISNSTDGRPTVRFFEPLSSIVSYADQDKIRSGLTATRIERFVNDGVAASQATSRGVERSPFDRHAPKVDRVAIEKGVLSFNSDRPCCCQRKERFSQGISLHNQDSQLLRRRRMSSVTLPATEKQLTCISDPMLTSPNMKPEFVPRSSWSTTGSEKGVPPVIKPPESSPSFKDHPSDEMRFLAHTDCGSTSPSASNPILRLMGKNLMVVNKDEDASMLQRQVQPQTQNVQKTSQLPTPSAVCPGNNPKQDPFVFHHMIPHSSVISSQDSHSMEGQCSKVGLLSGFRSYSEWKLPQAPARLPAGMFRDQGSDGSFTTLEPYEYKVDHRFPGRECMLKNRPNASSAYSMEKSKATPHSQHNPSVSSVPPVKEIIVTDDVHEGENFLTSDVLRYSEGWRESQVVSSAVSIPTVSSHSGNSFGPLSCYDSQDHAYLDSSPVMHNANIHATSTRLATARPNTWVCTLEGPGVLHGSPFGSAPSSASHLRPAALYYPPGYS